MSKIEAGPHPENEKSAVEKLEELKASMVEVKQTIDSQIDELVKEISRIISAAQDKSISSGREDEVIREMLESQAIMKEVQELREASERLQNLIDQLGNK